MRLRAERLGLAEAMVEVAAETSVEDIVATVSQGALAFSGLQALVCQQRP